MNNAQELKAHLQDRNKARIYAEKKNKHNVLIARMYEEKKKQDKLKQILAICETNKKVDWVSADMEVFEEFDVIIKLLKEVIDEQQEEKEKKRKNKLPSM